ncbi:MAG: bifunctional phosphoglucose/phosphomannose isomerase [Anaerolineae bacterium]|nr:bifunctional phosphoglucose/phosphomannose isomerase [Anaerolineae bacterium]
MKLDAHVNFAEIDVENMYGEIEGLPDQLDAAWRQAGELPLPLMEGIRNILVSGVGGSAIGADLVASYVIAECPVPIVIHRDYGLPAWAKGAETLVVASSHSGNTEETLSTFEAALQRGCRTLAICTGGKLAEMARAAQQPVWHFAHQGMPRAAVGFSSIYFLAALCRLGLVSVSDDMLYRVTDEMRRVREALAKAIPIAKNPAKQLAEQLYGRWAIVIGSGYLAPVARRWKGQFNELAKAWGQFEFLPEADHNTLAGIQVPKDKLAQCMTLFLVSASDHPRNRLRAEFTRDYFKSAGMGVNMIAAWGNDPLSHIWSTLYFGDFVAYYLAMCYDIDPTPITVMENLKAALKKL